MLEVLDKTSAWIDDALDFSQSGFRNILNYNVRKEFAELDLGWLYFRRLFEYFVKVITGFKVRKPNNVSLNAHYNTT